LGSPIRLCDIGAGAGFPTLPFAAVMPPSLVQILAVDSTSKKIAHIAETAAACGFSHVQALAGRAEDLSKNKPMREKFHLATARAVADLRILVELTAPFVRVGGYVVALKGSRGKEEMEGAADMAAKLGLAEPQLVEYCLPSGDGRSLVLYPKIKHTPAEFPRPFAKIKQA